MRHGGKFPAAAWVFPARALGLGENGSVLEPVQRLAVKGCELGQAARRGQVLCGVARRR